MKRLIDAEHIREVITQDWFLEILATKESKEDLKRELGNIIDSVPTAYDVEKVVGQIQKKHCKRCRNILSILGAEVYCKEQKCQIEELCKIVRKGGAE